MKFSVFTLTSLTTSLIVLAASCGSGPAGPPPQKSKFIVSEGGGVTADKSKDKPFTYSYTFHIEPGTPLSTALTVRFPSPDGVTVVPVEMVGPLVAGKSYSVESEPFSKIANNTAFTFYVELSDRSDNRVFDNLEQEIRFDMSPSVQKSLGLQKNIQ